MRSLPLSFRGKLLLSLVGTVGLLLGATLLVVRHETAREVRLLGEQAAERSRYAFEELERLRQTDLARLSLRFTGSNRLPSALQAAFEAEDPSILREAAEYELALAEIPRALVSVADLEGRPVVTLLDGEPRPELAPADGADVDRLLTVEPAYFAYEFAGGRLYTVHHALLDLFGQPVGVLTLGLPVDDELAARLGRVVDAEVCFAVRGDCVAGTPGLEGLGLSRLMPQVGQWAEPTRVRLGERRWALVADRLGGESAEAAEATEAAWRVIVVPLEGVLAPLDRIRRTAAWSGLGALLLALLLGRLLSLGLTRPLRALVAATEQIARGNLGHRVEVASRDEIGTLARAFNEMTAGLRLKEQYRGVLDKVVSPEIATELLRGEITLGGETRRISVLFGDLRGFTSMTEGMEPQAVITLLNEFLERASEAVDAEGGVVDKYVGDEVMAIFGAPVSHPDDALRAVRAGIRIRDAVAALNRERAARREPPLAVGIGINTGLAVAGNTGSPSRLNYTVLGESVNLAARLCSLAEPGEILVSGDTYAEVVEQIEALPLGERAVKGLSRPIPVHAVQGVRAAEHRAAAGAKAMVPTLALALLALLGSPLAAQQGAPRGAMPDAHAWLVIPSAARDLQLRSGMTNESAGFGIAQAEPAPRIASDLFQYALSGRLTLEGYLPQEEAPWIIEETRPFVAGRLSLFLDLLLGSRLYGLAELRAHRGEAPADRPLTAAVQQGFLRLTPLPEQPLSLQLGKFASPFGGYALRHHTPADPLIRPPLFYDYRTVVSSRNIPRANNGFLDWKNEAVRRPQGAPIVWAVPYPTGAMLFGGPGRLHYRLAAVNSALGSEPGEWNPRFDQRRPPSYLAHLAYAPIPELRLGVSYHRGPYLEESVAPDNFPAGSGVRDFDQEAWGFQAAFARGLFEGNAELVLDRWQVPNVVHDPRDRGYYVEGKLKLLPGLFVAGRYNVIDFNRIERLPPAGSPEGAGQREPWDHDVRRWQLGAGYRLARASEIRVEYLHTWTRAPVDPRDDLLSLQWWWEF